jgi:hypothetical protein
VGAAAPLATKQVGMLRSLFDLVGVFTGSRTLASSSASSLRNRSVLSKVRLKKSLSSALIEPQLRLNRAARWRLFLLHPFATEVCCPRCEKKKNIDNRLLLP